MELLTPVVLAYWIMGDGSWSGSGVKLHTNSNTKKEVLLLIESLNTKFNFHCTINTANNEKSQYIIYIPSKDMPHLKFKKKKTISFILHFSFFFYIN
jgi:hypothetical protein